MSRGALDQRIVPGDARLLAGFRDAINVAAEGDHGVSGAPRRPPGRGHAGHALLHGETVLAQHRCEVAPRLDLLEAEFGEAEQLVDDDLGQLLIGVDVGGDLFKETVESRVVLRHGGRSHERGRHDDESEDGGKSHTASPSTSVGHFAVAVGIRSPIGMSW
jgi:hypothetical protein